MIVTLFAKHLLFYYSISVVLVLRMMAVTSIRTPLSSTSSSNQQHQQRLQNDNHIQFIDQLYKEARQQRILHGPVVAQPYYERIIRIQEQQQQQQERRNKDSASDSTTTTAFIDRTTATRIALNVETLSSTTASPNRHHPASIPNPAYQALLNACTVSETTLTLVSFNRSSDLKNDNTTITSTTSTKELLEQVRDWLYYTMNYTSAMVDSTIIQQQQQEPTQTTTPTTTANGKLQHKVRIQRRQHRAPIYIKPATSGSMINISSHYTISETSTIFDCQMILLSLFLFGLCISISDMERIATNRSDSSSSSTIADIVKYITILKQLGILVHCQYDPSLIYSVVSIVPIDLLDDDINSTSTTTTNSKNNNIKTMYVVTDWHPRVLNMIQFINNNRTNVTEEAVMYVSPDSLALIEHFTLYKNKSNHLNYNGHVSTTATNQNILDLCCGSGIQALSYLFISRHNPNHHQYSAKNKNVSSIVCVDTNVRALRFCHFNALFNGLYNTPNYNIALIHGDVVHGNGTIYAQNGYRTYNEVHQCDSYQPLVPLLRSIHDQYDIILANPPFIPVPPAPSTNNTTTTSSSSHESNSNDSNNPSIRYGLFSSGGPSGEIVLAAILALSNILLNPNNGIVAIVSEFFFRNISSNSNNSSTSNRMPDNDAVLVDNLLKQLVLYCKMSDKTDNYQNVSCSGMLLTNEFPINASLYAYRRADNIDEVQMWEQHLQKENIVSCSPGFLFVQKTMKQLSTEQLPSDCAATAAVPSQWIHHIVPKSDMGSIWTPTNINAIAFTQTKLHEFLSRQ